LNRIFLALFIVFTSFSSMAVDDDFGARTPLLISNIYREGSYLIYDCKDRHFACVDEESYNGCRERREKALRALSKYLECAPLKKFDTQKKCRKVHYEQMHSVANKSFCLRSY
jgi:hypothetical protein